ncbi:hypothetical protein HALLA_19400 [Halostagnicola larsenii XH-48]|uniref:DUF5518 domain-containing protein n=1 Tax=Halostagnicola larsenii XH-48 TaxID=797299 RepID=W0JTJ2_9EURY|nr:DUF5518 domain-containing protein [Halostagnicola larsenii]AHG00632.1 hypothetical protein HALLA_19400 [Halostagnicola larsenii XH-48]
MVSGRTLVNAVIGAVVGVVFSFLPISPAIGGAVAGFLEGPDGRDGAVAGALAGLIMFLPMAVMAMLVLAFFGFGVGFVGVPAVGALFGLVVLGLIIGTIFVSIVGLSVLGGLLGAYVAREYPDKHAASRETIGMGRESPRPRETAYSTSPSTTGERSSEADRSGRADDGRVDDREPGSYWDRDRPPVNDDFGGFRAGTRDSPADERDDERDRDARDADDSVDN